ncbi:MAG: methyltransferase domain-containing protein [Magnetococcales bacterium]|nr:methyltransferase domain-containing protein [Magnetococcales bacterium]
MLWRVRAWITRRIQPWLSVSLRRELLDRDLHGLRSVMTGRVLEIGAGRESRRGAFQPPFSGVEAWLLVDLSCGNRPHVCGDVTSLPLPEASFDTVVCLEVLEYVADPLLALRELHRVVMPGGRLILSVPFMHRWDAERDYWRPTPPGLTFCLTRTGWCVESLQTQGGILAVLVNVTRHLLAKHPKSTGWLMVCLLLDPLLRWMTRLDPRVTARSPTFATFSTGMLVVGRSAPRHDPFRVV